VPENGSLFSELVADYFRNPRQFIPGLGGRFESEYAASLNHIASRLKGRSATS
jgi:hypothetical protein